MISIAQYLAKKSVVIFLFYGVITRQPPGVRNYTQKHMLRDVFVDHLKTLKTHGMALSMDDIIYHHQNKIPFPDNSFAITFDDGFENNYSVAAPELASLSIPATFYVTSEFIEENTLSWIDKIEYCLDITPKGALHCPWQPKPISFKKPQDKIALLSEIRYQVKQDPTFNIPPFVGSVFEQCRQSMVNSLPDRLSQKMTWAQVKTLHAHPLFTIGGHSHTHPILAFLDDTTLQTEITTSLQMLKKANIQSPHYSYPEGLAHCYDERAITLLKKNNIVCCPTAIMGKNDEHTDLFHLKRVML